MGKVFQGRTILDFTQPHFIPALAVPTGADAVLSFRKGDLTCLVLCSALQSRAGTQASKAALLSSIRDF